MLMGRGDQFVRGIIVADAVTAAGTRGLDWEQVSRATADWAFLSGRGLTDKAAQCRSYRLMQALEATGLFEIVGDTSPQGPRQRVRRIRFESATPTRGAA